MKTIININLDARDIMVASHIDGRLRVRDEALKRPSTAVTLREGLIEGKGIIDVTVNRRVGSLLVIYDRAVTGIKGILAKITAYLGARAMNSITKQATNIGMLASLALSVAAAMAGSTGLHVASGLLFMGFLAMHFLRHKKMGLA